MNTKRQLKWKFADWNKHVHVLAQYTITGNRNFIALIQ